MHLRFFLFHRFLAGGICGGLAFGTSWLLLGDDTPTWLPIAGGTLLVALARATVSTRRRRDNARLQAQYDAPAYGDGPQTDDAR